MEHMQALIDGLSAAWQKERAATQMTLGDLISALEAMPPHAEVANLNKPDSYRGYYCDLAFELGEGTRPAQELAEECRNSMGKVFEGYKGGDFMMGESTPVWVAGYGECGEKLISLTEGGRIETAPDE